MMWWKKWLKLKSVAFGVILFANKMKASAQWKAMDCFTNSKGKILPQQLVLQLAA